MEKVTNSSAQRSSTPGKTKDTFSKVVINSSKTKRDIINLLNYDVFVAKHEKNLSDLSKYVNDGVVDETSAEIKNLDYEVIYYLNVTRSAISLTFKYSLTNLKYGWNYDKTKMAWVPCGYMVTNSFPVCTLSSKTNQLITDTLLDLYSKTDVKQREVLVNHGLA